MTEVTFLAAWARTSPRTKARRTSEEKRGDTRDGGKNLEESRACPRLQELLHAERGDNRDARAVEVALPAEAVWVECEQGEEKARDGEERRYRPVVDGLATPLPEISCGEGPVQAFLEFFLPVGEERELCAEGADFGVVGESDSLSFVFAVVVGFGEDFAKGFPAEFFAGGLDLGFGVQGASFCCLAGYIRL